MCIGHGYGYLRQYLGQRSDHCNVILKKARSQLRLSVPNHKELDRGLLRSLIRDAGLTVDEFLALL